MQDWTHETRTLASLVGPDEMELILFNLSCNRLNPNRMKKLLTNYQDSFKALNAEGVTEEQKPGLQEAFDNAHNAIIAFDPASVADEA